MTAAMVSHPASHWRLPIALMAASFALRVGQGVFEGSSMQQYLPSDTMLDGPSCRGADFRGNELRLRHLPGIRARRRPTAPGGDGGRTDRVAQSPCLRDGTAHGNGDAGYAALRGGDVSTWITSRPLMTATAMLPATPPSDRRRSPWPVRLDRKARSRGSAARNLRCCCGT